MFNIAKLVRELGTRDQCIQFAEVQGLIASEKLCRVHRKPMRIDLTVNNNVGAFVCNTGTCRTKARIPRGKGTWFENVRISLPHVFYLMYCFSHNWPINMVILEDIDRQEERCLSRATITDWYNNCREVVVIYHLERQENLPKIGGPGKVVQIDEYKFGKRRYNKGRRVEGHWIVGMIEDGSEDLRLEVCPDNICSSDVLIPIINKHVEKGSIIHTDFWRAYDCLGEHGFIHKKVNHSDPDNPFVAPDGTHTQRIESQWRVVKQFFGRENYNHPSNFADIIVEYQWRRSVERSKKDPFLELIKTIRCVYNK